MMFTPPLLHAVAGLDSHALGASLPLWSVAHFVAMLASIALLPLVWPHGWESNRTRGLVAFGLGAPVAIGMALRAPDVVGHTAWEYLAFIVLLGSLYVTAGGIILRGRLPGRPMVNAGLLGLGALLASLIGTTGASMLLIRPLLRANAGRARQAHVVVFFIFLVSNIGGLLTPLGDPPLFLGFLRGVPFGWTLRLVAPWGLSCGVLLALFYGIDRVLFAREANPLPHHRDDKVPLELGGVLNFAWLAALVALILASGAWHLPAGTQEVGMLAIGALAWTTTPAGLRRENGFSWAPMAEVAIVFAGIFATMMPALAILNARGGELGITEPWQFFWLTGLLSSLLDNAPTYLTFTATASALLGTDAGSLGELLASARGETLLAAISMGAVMMGANTYIGNGPNFMVKAVAEAHGVRMPNFFGYMGVAMATLLPLFGLVTWVFLTGAVRA